jgi:hypothetical protein
MALIREVPDSDVRSGLGGWLILPAINLAANAILLIALILGVVAASFVPELQGQTARPETGLYAAVRTVAYLGLLIFTVFIGYLFFCKRKETPRYLIAYIWVLFVCLSGLALWGHYLEVSGQIASSLGAPTSSLLASILWTWYFRVSKRVRVTFVNSATAQQARWLTYGVNVVMALVLAVIVAAAAVYLSGELLRGKGRSDWTSAGDFRLSPQTKALVADLPFNVTLTNLYYNTPEAPDSLERWKRVQDLLTEYANVNPSRVTVEAINPAVDVGGVEGVVARLRERYKGQSEKPKAILEEFQPLLTEMSTALLAEAKRLGAAADAWKDGPADNISTLRMIKKSWEDAARQNQIQGALLQAFIEQEGLPDYTTAVGQARAYAEQASENMTRAASVYKQMLDLLKTPPPAEVKAVLAGAKEAYGPVLEKIGAFTRKAAEVKASELDQVSKELGQGQAVLIETPNKVLVVGFDEMWTPNPASVNIDEEEEPSLGSHLFVGEAAISSALLGLEHEDKPAIIFVTYAGAATEGRGQFVDLADRLRKLNFIVQDWDLLRQHTPPQVPHATKMIYVLTPPSINPQMQGQIPPPTPETYKPVLDAIKAGAPALVLMEPGGLMSPTVPYGDLAPLFGLTARFNAVAVQKSVVDAATGAERANNQLTLKEFADHPITRPIKGLTYGIAAACPLLINDKLPEGVTVAPLINLPAGPDFWADTDVYAVQQLKAKFDAAEDLPGPLPLAVAATRQIQGGPEQKVVFFGGHVAENQILRARGQNGQLVVPGNAELLVNSALWVSGTDQLIRTSPEVLQARRIGEIGRWELPIRVLVLAGLPVTVLVFGILVYFIRRR